MKECLNALIIDDEPQIGRFITHVLTLDGWHVKEARNAEQAFEMSYTQQWLLVFCDVLLGGTDGYEVLRHFSQQQVKARFVLMTGQGSAVGALEATTLGAYDYLVKPFTVNDILNISAAVQKQN